MEWREWLLNLSLPSTCTINIGSITAGSSGGGGGENVPSFTYYTSFVTSSQVCLYYISESNQVIFNSDLAYYYSRGLTFQSTSDLAWTSSILDPVILPFTLNVGDKISFYDSASRLGWNEAFEYTIKNVVFTGSGETGSRIYTELDRPVNLALFNSGSGNVDAFSSAPWRACRYVVWKHIPDETNVMLRYNPKDASIVENGLLFPQYIDPTVRENSGKFGLKQLFDSYRKDLTTTQRESVVKNDLKKIIKENITEIKENKHKRLIQEENIIGKRLSIITEGVNVKSKEQQRKISKEMFNETIYLSTQGYDKELISESLFDIFSGLFPKGVAEPIMQYFKEEAAKWLAGKLGLDPNSWMSSIIISAIGDLNIGDVSKLTDCNFVTKWLSKSIAEGVVRKIQVEKFGDNAFYNLIRNTMVEALEVTKLGTMFEESLGKIICPLVSNLSGKMEGAADVMKQKALGSA